MNKLLKIIVGHSLTDLFKHKSFFLLMFILILLDRGLKFFKDAYHIRLGLPAVTSLNHTTADFIFNRLPEQLINLLADYRIAMILAGLFLLKQIISLWPSSDMRRMHRSERGRFGLLASLGAIGLKQLLWDATALATLVLAVSLWCCGWFFLHRLAWRIFPSLFWLATLLAAILIIFPMVLAGFSYSSKLAVISKGTFKEKLVLFYQLFFNRRLAYRSWVFYCARLVIEALFVAALPAYILLTVDNFLLRIFLAALAATPVYSFLKMASFKFFLVVYEEFPLVRQEYQAYYQKVKAI